MRPRRSSALVAVAIPSLVALYCKLEAPAWIDWVVFLAAFFGFVLYLAVTEP